MEGICILISFHVLYILFLYVIYTETIVPNILHKADYIHPNMRMTSDYLREDKSVLRLARV